MTRVHVPIEIARLQNSLRHLKRTQDELCAHSDHDDDHDPELTLALKENEAVMSVLFPPFPLLLPKKHHRHHLVIHLYLYYPLATLSARTHYCSASQGERIDMLNLALVGKGVITSSSHYGPTQNSIAVAPQTQPPVLPSEATMDELHDDEEGGIVL
jgi:hypothetical protein